MIDQDTLIKRACAGDEQALADLFEQHRTRLKRMITLRMDPRVQGRLDASDVLQDAYVDAARGLARYAAGAKLPFYLWLRLLAGQRLAKAHRMHLGAALRKAQLEISLGPARIPGASTMNLAAHLVGTFTSASGQVMRDELRAKVQAVLDEMEPHDREVLALRHFEEMTNRETACVLGISEAAAKSRYRRALQKITESFEQVPGLLEGFAKSAVRKSSRE